jgi:GNAT superfamily N-acetyltransferase
MQRTVMLRDGSTAVIRPVEPEDAGLLVDGFEALSDRSRYARFLTAVPRLPRHWVEDLVDLDHRDREALGALDPQTGAGVGVARYVRLDDDPEEAEFAIAIVDDWQGRGLGRILLGELVEAARANGLQRLSGDVLAENDRMLELGRTVGRDARIGEVHNGVVRLVVEL